MNVLLKVPRHDGRRYRRVTDNLAGQHANVLRLKYFIQVMEIINRVIIIIGVRRVNAELLVAVDKINKCIVSISGVR